jgi:hypothetical protein
MAEKKTVYGIVLGKTEAEEPLRRLERSWDDKVKMDLEVGLILYKGVE